MKTDKRTFIIQIETVILRATCNVLAVRRQADKVLLVLMARKTGLGKSPAHLIIATLPHFQLGIGGR